MTKYRRKLNEVEAEPCECGCDYVVVRDGAHEIVDIVEFEREYEPVSSEGDVPAGMALHLAAVNKVEAEKQHARAEAAEASLKLADELARECETALKHYHIHYGSREEIQAALSAYLESRMER